MSFRKEIVKKVCMLGDPAVGKTSLMKRCVLNVFGERYAMTTGVQMMKKIINIHVPPGQFVRTRLLINDIMGQKGFDQLHNRYFENASGAIAVCDLTRADTLESLEQWIASIREVSENVEVVVVANKADLEKKSEFGKTELELFKLKHGTYFFLTSAKTGVNVDKAFYYLSGKMLRNVFEISIE